MQNLKNQYTEFDMFNKEEEEDKSTNTREIMVI